MNCSVPFNLVIYPLQIVFVAVDDGQGDYLGNIIAVNLFDQIDDFLEQRGSP